MKAEVSRVDFMYSERVQEFQKRLAEFMDEFIYPNEKVYEEQLNEYDRFATVPPIMEELKQKAKERELWNLFLQIFRTRKPTPLGVG